MKEVIDYISNNSFLTTIIGVIVGAIITSFTTIYVSFKELKERKKEEQLRKKEYQYENKAELRIENYYNNNNKQPDIEVFLAPFKVDYTKGLKNYKFIFPNNIKDKKKHKYIDFKLKNVGKSDINQLNICATFKNHNILVDYQLLDNIIYNNIVDYSSCYDRKIFRGESILLRIYYLEGFQICHSFSCTLALLFIDSFNNCYEQPFWYENNNLYEPIPINYSQYCSYINPNDAYECFENPKLW